MFSPSGLGSYFRVTRTPGTANRAPRLHDGSALAFGTLFSSQGADPGGPSPSTSKSRRHTPAAPTSPGRFWTRASTGDLLDVRVVRTRFAHRNSSLGASRGHRLWYAPHPDPST